jgi:hypothetical protein
MIQPNTDAMEITKSDRLDLRPTMARPEIICVRDAGAEVGEGARALLELQT